MTARRPRRRIGLIATLTVVALLVALGIGVWVRIPRDDVSTITPGALTVSQDAAGSARFGDLTVTVSPAPGAAIEVSLAGEVVWSSPPGVSFLGAARGDLAAEEDRGYFWLRTGHEETWGEQIVHTLTETDRGVLLTGTLEDPSGDPGPQWQATFSAAGERVVLEAEVAGEAATSIGFWSARAQGAGVHGFGEQFSDFDLDGRLLPILVREQGVGRGEQPLSALADVTNNGAGGTEEMTYAAWASWVTGDLRGVRLDPGLPESHAIAVADLREEGRVGLEIHARRMRAQLTAASTPVDLISRQHSGTQRPELAEWASSGAIVGIQGGTQKVRGTVDSLRAEGAEIAGVWLQDWTGQRTTSFGDRLWWTWQLDEERYPGWDALVSDLTEEGIAVTTYANPFLVQPREGAGGRNLLEEAKRAGYLVTDAGGAPYALDQGGFDAYLVDLTDPGARAWFAEVIATEVLAHGVAGFMADFAEGLPLDAVLAGGEAHLLHNRWPGLWAQTVREGCELAGRPDCVRWFRAGSLGMDADSPLFWNGDQLVTFGAEDGLASVLGGTFSAGVSGWPLVHADVGGYTSINAVVKDYVRTPELLARWAEFAAFGVVMRSHEGNRPAENLQVYSTPETRAAFARATRIFAALQDYRAEVIAEATTTGVPAIRHGWLAAPGTSAAEVDSQFFLGASILVAPVLEEGAGEVEVTFPPGRWRHLLTGEEYDGGAAHLVPAPIGTPAAFVETSDPWAPRLAEALSGQ